MDGRLVAPVKRNNTKGVLRKTMRRAAYLTIAIFQNRI